MAKVFVFCVGGTGIRVMRSILMLAASGMDANGYDIVPVLVDPHVNLKANTDLNTAIGDYISVYNSLTLSGDGNQLNGPSGFFKTKITRWEDLNGQKNSSAASMSDNRSFGAYLNIQALNNSDVNNFLVETLYSEANLKNSLSVGFKGNPNVGTVVLNDMINGAVWYNAFLSHCAQGDRVFIISSIFGGTGASGYPLLEKKIKESRNFPQVQKAIMGAVTVLPYYSLRDPEASGSDIDSSSFYTKTKAALSYYEKSVKSDYLYYAGEQSKSPKANYDNDESKQEDKAHFIELIAATALFDFLRRPEPDTKPQAMTRAIRKDKDSLDFDSLGDGYADIVRNIADMMILNLLLDILPREGQFPLSKTRGFNKAFYNDRPFQKLKSFVGQFKDWYTELSENQRGFSPLNKLCPGGKLSDIVKGHSLKARNESFYLLKMIEAGNRKQHIEHKIDLRHFVDFAYKGIDEYTKNIKK